MPRRVSPKPFNRVFLVNVFINIQIDPWMCGKIAKIEKKKRHFNLIYNDKHCYDRIAYCIKVVQRLTGV